MLHKAQLLPTLSELMETTSSAAAPLLSSMHLSTSGRAKAAAPSLLPAALLQQKGATVTSDDPAAAAVSGTADANVKPKRPPTGGKDFLIATRCGVMNIGSMLIRCVQHSFFVQAFVLGL